jgi:hypothetical protein
MRDLSRAERAAFSEFACGQCRYFMFCSRCGKVQCAGGFELCVIPCRSFVESRLGVRAEDVKFLPNRCHVRFRTVASIFRCAGDYGFVFRYHPNHGYAVTVVMLCGIEHFKGGHVWYHHDLFEFVVLRGAERRQRSGAPVRST